MEDIFNLNRFTEAQNPIFDEVIAELKRENKQSHWMWFVFPQLKGLGSSSTAQYYGIQNLAEARAYLKHPILGQRLMQVLHILENSKGNNPQQIFGSIDALKLRSSLTLFSLADPKEEIFLRLLNKFYKGEKCSLTLNKLQ